MRKLNIKQLYTGTSSLVTLVSDGLGAPPLTTPLGLRPRPHLMAGTSSLATLVSDGLGAPPLTTPLGLRPKPHQWVRAPWTPSH